MIDPIIKVATYFKEFGNITAYYVGGCVRDELMGLPSEDIDICLVGASSKEFVNRMFDTMEFLGLIDNHSGLVGNTFGVWVVNIKGTKVEFALARSEKKVGTSHQDFVVDTKNITIEQDLYRRDFTINAIAKNVLTGEFTDPFNGIGDIQLKVLDVVSDAFSEDPLRALRAARFLSRFKFDPSYELYQKCKNLKPGYISLERVGLELKKTMEQAVKPSIFFQFLQDVFWIDHYFPELAALWYIEQDPEHHPEGNAYTHTMHCIDSTTDPFIRIVMLCHDMGKATTTVFNEEKQKWQAIGHEAAGVPITKEFLKRIHYDSHKEINRIACLVELHMIRIYLHGRSKDKVVRRFLRQLMHYELSYQQLADVVRADLAGRPPRPVPQGELIYESYAKELLESGAMEPIVTGKTLIEIGMEPGHEFGKIIDHALILQDRGTLTKTNWPDVLHGAGYKIMDYYYNHCAKQLEDDN